MTAAPWAGASITPVENLADALRIVESYIAERRFDGGGLLHVALWVERSGVIERTMARWEDLPGQAKTRQELMESRSPQFIALDARAAKGHFATPPVTRQERALIEQFSVLSQELGRQGIDDPPPTDRAW